MARKLICSTSSELCALCFFVGFGVVSVVWVFYWEEKVKNVQCFGVSVHSYPCMFICEREIDSN